MTKKEQYLKVIQNLDRTYDIICKVKDIDLSLNYYELFSILQELGFKFIYDKSYTNFIGETTVTHYESYDYEDILYWRDFHYYDLETDDYMEAKKAYEKINPYRDNPLEMSFPTLAGRYYKIKINDDNVYITSSYTESD